MWKLVTIPYLAPGRVSDLKNKNNYPMTAADPATCIGVGGGGPAPSPSAKNLAPPGMKL